MTTMNNIQFVTNY